MSYNHHCEITGQYAFTEEKYDPVLGCMICSHLRPGLAAPREISCNHTEENSNVSIEGTVHLTL